MLKLVFTVDYEIHGNGDGCPRTLMVEPTARLLRLLEGYGAKLTIMADVAEILKFKQHKERTGRDDYHYEAIAEQLRRAVAAGHDVQLHLHSSYFNATLEQRRWVQDWAEYDFARLPFERMDWMVRTGKDYLETLLRPVDPTYACVAFRAANWSVSPSPNVVRVLVDNGIHFDTSVFKYGRRSGLVAFDYSQAHSALLPWRVSTADICRRDDRGRLWELPIYSEKRWIGAFVAPGRLRRVISGLGHTVRSGAPADAPGPSRPAPTALPKTPWLKAALRRHAWKADFNQCNGRQLIGALHRAAAGCPASAEVVLPFVLIGHSKLFTQPNEHSLRPLLAHVARRASQFGFDTLRGIGRSRKQWEAL